MAFCGVIVGLAPDAIVLQTEDGEQRFTLSPDTVAWRGAKVPTSALVEGDQVVIRRKPAQPGDRYAAAPVAVERVWAGIGRVSGIIVEAKGAELLVDTGHLGRASELVVLTAHSLRQVQVRFPRLAPGYLIDLLGVRRQDYLLAVAPATAQPPHLAGHSTDPPPSGHTLIPVTGTAVWHEPVAVEPPGLHGVGYPALDPETECYQCNHAEVGRGCVRLPYLSVGSSVWLRNDCTNQVAVLPVTSCAATARRFCDRCVQCGTSPRGRLADLTMAAFVALGGNLEDGCFNATLARAA